jgi:hypothetical protein
MKIFPLTAAALAAIAACALSACAGSTGPAVASAPASTPAGQAAPAQGARTGEGGGGMLLGYSQCMRSHGVANFPGLSTGTVITLQTLQGDGVDTSAPAYQKAVQACRPLLSSGSAGGGIRQHSSGLLAFAQCVRRHGIPGFPDPVVKGGTVALSLKGTGITPQSPVFQAAVQACIHYMRQQGAGGGAS